MKQSLISKKQFVSWLVVFTIGMAVWVMWGGTSGLALLALVASNLILMGAGERSRAIPAREMLLIFASLIVFIGLGIASKRWLPSDFGEPAARALQHPALVVPLWALAVWLVYRRYRLSKSDSSVGVPPMA